MGFFKSLFGGSNTPETEKEKNDKKNFEILKYDGIRARHMGKLPYAIKCFEEAVAINDEMETLTLLANVHTSRPTAWMMHASPSTAWQKKSRNRSTLFCH